MYGNILKEEIFSGYADNRIEAVGKPFYSDDDFMIYCHRCAVKGLKPIEKLLIRIQMNDEIQSIWPHISQRLLEIKSKRLATSFMKIEIIYDWKYVCFLSLF